jgi:acyl carrier protein
MGMDMFELRMSVEEAFEIEIPDEEAAKVSTVLDLYTLVWRRLSGEPSRRCPSSALFYRIRRALMDIYGAPRQSIRPSTPMAALLPSRDRAEQWRRLSDAIDARLPDLEPPPWLGRLLTGAGLGLLVACFAAYFVKPFGFALACTLGGSLLWWAANLAAIEFAGRIPRPCTTVGGTVRAVVGWDPSRWSGSERAWQPNQVWEKLRELIIDQLEAAPGEVTADARFDDDLGAD